MHDCFFIVLSIGDNRVETVPAKKRGGQPLYAGDANVFYLFIGFRYLSKNTRTAP